jgi:predicted  nucleic acid-binding Zn-ribbon protein
MIDKNKLSKEERKNLWQLNSRIWMLKWKKERLLSEIVNTPRDFEPIQNDLRERYRELKSDLAEVINERYNLFWITE